MAKIDKALKDVKDQTEKILKDGDQVIITVHRSTGKQVEEVEL